MTVPPVSCSNAVFSSALIETEQVSYAMIKAERVSRGPATTPVQTPVLPRRGAFDFAEGFVEIGLGGKTHGQAHR